MNLLALLLAVWLKGNVHTHTLASDGDTAPAAVAQWYATHGYDFLIITDHDAITRVDDPAILLIPGEEVTDRLQKKPLHVNALGIEKVVKPQGGATVVEVLQHDIDAVREAGGIPLVNHPNFGWAFGAAELKELKHAALLEIASGHPLINAGGPPSAEEMWDELLTGGAKWFAVAVDDAHHFQCPPPSSAALGGQGWIVVRAEKAEAKQILAAIERGDFYASTGVELADYAVSSESMTVTIKVPAGSSAPHYRTEFIGPNGRVLAATDANPATYAFRGGERYVRARVTDSNGKHAWTQPAFR